jgi:hypothetical protein
LWSHVICVGSCGVGGQSLPFVTLPRDVPLCAPTPACRKNVQKHALGMPVAMWVLWGPLTSRCCCHWLGSLPALISAVWLQLPACCCCASGCRQLPALLQLRRGWGAAAWLHLQACGSPPGIWWHLHWCCWHVCVSFVGPPFMQGWPAVAVCNPPVAQQGCYWLCLCGGVAVGGWGRQWCG